MSAHIVIRDGVPKWWLSTDIWTVPGKDPNGLPGPPVAGQPAYLWALVTNNGDSAAPGTRVDFYWANPATQILVGTVSAIGSAFVDLQPGGDAQPVLCLVPWVPVMVNSGHECLIAVAHATNDANPVPDPLPAGYAFDPPAHDQIAQRNLSVLAAGRGPVLLPVTVTAHARADKNVLLFAQVGGVLDATLLTQLRLSKARPAGKDVVKVGLSHEPRCIRDHEPEGEKELRLHIPAGTSAAVYASISAAELPYDEYQLVHIVERSGDTILGGVSYVVVHAQEEAVP